MRQLTELRVGLPQGNPADAFDRPGRPWHDHSRVQEMVRPIATVTPDSSVRIGELSLNFVDLGRAIQKRIENLGVEVTSHSNTLDDETARRIIEAIQGQDAHAGSLKSLKVKGEEAEKGVGQTKKRESRGPSSRQSAKGALAEEPKKPEKKDEPPRNVQSDV